jgi:hypothetical protein
MSDAGAQHERKEKYRLEQMRQTGASVAGLYAGVFDDDVNLPAERTAGVPAANNGTDEARQRETPMICWEHVRKRVRTRGQDP